jgi:hypothetical protein
MGATSEKYDCSGDADMKPEDCILGKPGTEITCYKLKQKNFSLTESYKVKDQNDKTAYKVKGIFFTLKDRMIVYGDDDDEGDEIAVIQKKWCQLRKHNRQIFRFIPAWEGQESTDDYEGKLMYRWGIVEKRCIVCCDGPIYDYYKYTPDGGKVGVMTLREQCMSCMFNMRVCLFGTD